MPEPLTALARQTKDFIAVKPTTVVLSRNVKEDDGASGYTTTPTDLDPQVFRVAQQRQAVTVERRNSAGEVVSVAMTLVCMPGSDIQRDDTFKWLGLDAEVVWITDLDYVLHAEVAI